MDGEEEDKHGNVGDGDASQVQTGDTLDSVIASEGDPTSRINALVTFDNQFVNDKNDTVTYDTADVMDNEIEKEKDPINEMVNVELDSPCDSAISESTASHSTSEDVAKSSSISSSPCKLPDSFDSSVLESSVSDSADNVQGDNTKHSGVSLHDPSSESNDCSSYPSLVKTECKIDATDNSPDHPIQPHIYQESSEKDSLYSTPDHSSSVITADQDSSRSPQQNTVTVQSQNSGITSSSNVRNYLPEKQDINDQLLSELDAELDITEAQIENDLADLPNGMSQRKVSLSDLPEYKELKTNYESLQKHLEQQIIDAQKYKSEMEKASSSLSIAIKERDSYLERLQLQEKGHDGYVVKIKELEFALSKQQKEMGVMKEKMSSHDAAAKRAVTTLQGELKNKTDHLSKMYDECKKEKETMVMKYAQAEAKNIELQEKMYKNEQKIIANNKEKDAAMTKFKIMKQEKQKMQEIYDNRAMEIASLRREIERLKELVHNNDLKSKWAHNKLKAELEAHKDTKAKVEDLQRKLKVSRDEIDQIKKSSEAAIRSYQESEEAKARNLDDKLKETQCELMMHRQEKSDQDEMTTAIRSELETLKVKHKELIDEIKLYRDKVQCLDDERLHQEDTLTKFKDTLQNQKAENVEMKIRLEQLENVEEDILIERAKVTKAKKRVDEIETNNRDLVSDMEACARRETEYLELQQKLSDKNVVLQSENSALSAKLKQISHEHEVLTKQCAKLETKLEQLESELAMVKKARHEETTNLSMELEKKTKEAKDLSVKLEEEKGEIKTLKRKHAANTKDLTRQLQQAKRRLEILEKVDRDGTSVGSMGSRTSSNGSLDTLGNNAGNRSNQSHEPATTPVQEEFHPIVEVVEIDKSMLMEKISKLQKIHARKNEKIEFVEDHNRQLLDELKKKTKIIQNYVMREEAGTLSPEQSDNNKAQLAKKGGIMASLYSQHVQDGQMTLDLSLEITQKLQQVLEDTLLKNITLKENIETLGREIARLSQENRGLQLKMQDLQDRIS